MCWSKSHIRERIVENEATVRAAQTRTCVIQDKLALIAAVGLGKNFEIITLAASAPDLVNDNYFYFI